MASIADAIDVLAPTAIQLVDYKVSDEGVGPVLAYWNTAKLGTQPTPAQIAAVTPGQIATARTAKLRALAVTLTTDPDAPWKLVRAVILVAMDEGNIWRQWDTDFKAQVAAATSFANLQARVAAMPATPQRVKSQLIDAVVAKLNTTDADA